MHHLESRLLVMCVALTLLSRGASGQTARKLELHVIDSVSGAPVGHAEVRVLKTLKDTGGWMIRQTTDSTGHAVVAAPTNEQLLMMVRRLGFASSLFPVAATDSDDVFVVALAPAAARLAPTITLSTPLSHELRSAGFYERQRVRPGVFLDSAAIVKLKPLDLMAVIRQYVTGCTVIYVDGLLLYDLRDVDVRRVVGIEVYHSNSEAPPEFHNPIDSEHRCGSIVIWRRN